MLMRVRQTPWNRWNIIVGSKSHRFSAIRRIERENLSQELSCCSCHVSKEAYTIQEAAEAYGVGKDTLRAHINLGNIAVRYPSSRPVIATDELRSWFDSLPEERG